MEKELIKKATELFNTSEKWDAFLELITLKDKIVNQWSNKIKEEIVLNIVMPSIWTVVNREHGLHWYIKDLGEESIGIWLEGARFSLWADSNKYKTEDIIRALSINKYNALLNSLPKSENQPQRNFILREEGKFEFGSVYDNDFDYNHLAWFAGNKTDEFIEQVRIKLTPFFNSTDLIIELNNSFKI